MPTYSTPGVYVTETPLTSLTSNSSGVTSAVFFGTAERGPTTLTLIQDWNTYRSLFGELANAYDLGYAVYHYFTNGGRACYVRRIVDAAAVTAAYTSHPFYPTGVGQASASLFNASAISQGTWGNDLTVTTLIGNTPSTATVFGTFTVVVTLSGVEVERWPDLTINPNGNRFVSAVINNYSRYIRVSAVNTSATANVALTYNTTAKALTAGASSAPIDTDFTAALTDLDLVEGALILNAVGKTSATVVTAFMNKASSRGDSFVIIDPSSADTTLAAIQATAANYSGLSNGGYAAVYAPMLEMVDPAKTGSGARRTTFPGGAVAGLFVRTEVERTVAKAPAGYSADIRGALGLTVQLSDANIGTLYDGTPQVNSFKAIPGAGVTVYGARTLQKVDPDKFINVRRTINYVKANLKEITKFAIFEPNDLNLWNSINMRVSGFLADFWRAGGLKGARATDAFFVLCDSTNNTISSIDNGVVNVQVGVALQYPAEFIVINLSQWTGGSNAIES